MATAKKTPVDKSMASKVITSAKDMFDGAVVAVSDAFAGSPARKGPIRTAQKPRAKTAAAKKGVARETGTKKAVSKKAVARKAPGKMDARLVSTMEVYEIKYLAQKHRVTQKAVKDAVTKVGHSRNKVEAELKAQRSKSA